MKYLTVFTVVIVIALMNTPIQSNDEVEQNIPNESLECYVCNDCPRVTINTTSMVCLPSGNGVSQSCLVYMERIIVTNRPLIVRGCSSERGTCAEIMEIDNIHKDMVELVSCIECTTNNCNTNSGINRLTAHQSIVVYFAIMLLIPLYFFFCNIVYPQISFPKYHTTIFHV
ncbi:uncharacterized protein LOC113231344 [Hyposmocoma kahamanoa]|uniref:uncharacterized protein LOC113231344 n=1 Tax=Hyposmocoma kahamanoa TaxID=1477025 RepID=UPI000E6D633F|nr:uncharacterized protein LOC113231344 [Hyposmocoma kahamanoa]